MLNKIDFYFFSPTGGTRKCGELLAGAIAKCVVLHDLTNPRFIAGATDGELAIIAVPVFGGRIPALAAERLHSIQGNGKKAVMLAVYGVRAYEDALLELNDIAKTGGFQVVASGAFVAQHSVVPEVGTGRPDAQDAQALKDFGQRILEKLESGLEGEVTVPGNRPYKPAFTASATPISLDTCNLCRKCIETCPSEAIVAEDGRIVTEISKCSMCMACVAACPASARVLPPTLQSRMNQMLGALKDVRRENETYL